MTDQTYVVIRASDGKFMESTGLWVGEFPDANQFPNLSTAKASIKRCWRGLCYVYSSAGYGSGELPVSVMNHGRSVT